MNTALVQETEQLHSLITGLFGRVISQPLMRFTVDTVVYSALKVNENLDIGNTSNNTHCRVTCGSCTHGEAVQSGGSQPSNDLEVYLNYNRKRIAQDFDFPVKIDKTLLLKALAKSKDRIQNTYDCKLNTFFTDSKEGPVIVIELNSNRYERPISIRVNV